MGVVNYKKLVEFRQQLRIEGMKVLSEFNSFEMTVFVIDDVAITGYTIKRLMKIVNFGIISLYYDDHTRIALSVPDEELE